MSTKAKRQATGSSRHSSQRWPGAKTNKQLEAYLLSRDILRQIQRSSTLKPESHEGSVTRLH